MQEVRCRKCGKLLYQSAIITDDKKLTFDCPVCTKNIEYTNKGKIISISCKCSRCSEITETQF